MKTNNNQFRFPMSQAEAIRVLSPYLWDYEKREIHEHETIYFFNVNERIKNNLSRSQTLTFTLYSLYLKDLNHKTVEKYYLSILFFY